MTNYFKAALSLVLSEADDYQPTTDRATHTFENSTGTAIEHLSFNASTTNHTIAVNSVYSSAVLLAVMNNGSVTVSVVHDTANNSNMETEVDAGSLYVTPDLNCTGGNDVVISTGSGTSAVEVFLVAVV